MEEYVKTPAALRLINLRVVIHTVEKDLLNVRFRFVLGGLHWPFDFDPT
jgi:hypothetical protein